MNILRYHLSDFGGEVRDFLESDLVATLGFLPERFKLILDGDSIRVEPEGEMRHIYYISGEPVSDSEPEQEL